MRHGIVAAVLVAVALLASAAAHAAAASALIGAEVRDVRGETAGKVQDLIVDVRDGRVLYVIVDAGERFFTLGGALSRAYLSEASCADSCAARIA